MSWRQQYEARLRIQRRYRTVWRVPISKKLALVLQQHVPAGARVLDVGAGHRKAQSWLPGRRYESVDPDPDGEHEYQDLGDAQGPYDAALLLEVIEHLPLEEACTTLVRLRGKLAPGGVLVVSTPNTYHPPTYLRDATHITPFCYDELGGVLEVAGFEVVTIQRIYNDALWRKLLRRYVFGWLFRLLRLDFATQVAAVARVPG